MAKYEKESGRTQACQFRPAYRGIIDRKYARVAKKLAEREVGRAKSKGRADTEKRRATVRQAPSQVARFYDGSKIPSTPAGIKAPQGAWLPYEQEFGPCLTPTGKLGRGCTRPSSTASSAKRSVERHQAQSLQGRSRRAEEGGRCIAGQEPRGKKEARRRASKGRLEAQ